MSRRTDQPVEQPKTNGVEKAIVRYMNGQGTREEYLRELRRELDEIWQDDDLTRENNPTKPR